MSLLSVLLAAVALLAGLAALLRPRGSSGVVANLSNARPAVLAKRRDDLRHELGRLEDERELQRGVFEVSSELVGCVDESDARERFSAALRRYWQCSDADLLVWERGAWRSLGRPPTGPLPVLDQAVQLPGADGERDLVLDLSQASGQAAMVLRRSRPQPSIAGRSEAEQEAVAATLRSQLMLSLRRVALYSGLQALARVDPLTSTHRRWYGESRLKELVEHGEVVAVAMVDIDHFKRVNDEHGHAVGDQVLTAVGQALVGGLRGNDLVCRWGGEEFLVILPSTPPTGALLVAERLRAAVAALSGLPLTVTVSIGLAACVQDDTHFDLVARADEALYAAKRRGRNRVEVADPEDSGTQLRITSRQTRNRSTTSASSADRPAVSAALDATTTSTAIVTPKRPASDIVAP